MSGTVSHEIERISDTFFSWNKHMSADGDYSSDRILKEAKNCVTFADFINSAGPSAMII